MVNKYMSWDCIQNLKKIGLNLRFLEPLLIQTLQIQTMNEKYFFKYSDEQDQWTFHSIWFGYFHERDSNFCSKNSLNNKIYSPLFQLCEAH